jgi:hypothetical protein
VESQKARCGGGDAGAGDEDFEGGHDWVRVGGDEMVTRDGNGDKGRYVAVWLCYRLQIR